MRDERARGIRGLYVIIDPDACRARPLEVARLALEGGARVLQWRDKRRPAGEQLPDIEQMVTICRDHGALSVVNDYPQIAVAAAADAVHVGPDDMPVQDVRRIVGDRCLVGASTNNAEEARRAVAHGADYVAVGAIFPTSSKDTPRPADPDRIRDVKRAVDVPVVAIGGINASNIDLVVAAGADAAAVIRAVCAADDPRAAARDLAAHFDAR